MHKPLDGVRVADFTLHAAGPFCAHVLSLLGAEVIKIESAMRPDIFRRPHPVYGRMEVSPFEQVAANKLSVTLNLKEPRAIELAKKLVARCDMVLESFRPGVMQRLGLSYDDLRRVKPDIVMVSVSAYGQEGPDSALPGYAPLFAAAGGLGYLTGYADGPPVEIRHVMDHSVGMTAAFAALAALWQQRTSGCGRHVDVAAGEVASAFVGDALLAAAFGVPMRRRGNESDTMAPHGVYPCAGEDAWVSIAVVDDEQWQALIAIVDDSRLAVDRFSTVRERLQHTAEIDALLGEWTRGKDANAAAALLQAGGIPACPSSNAAQLATDPHLRARGTIVDFETDGDRRAVIGSLFRFSKTQSGIQSGTPALGEHNDRIFGDLLGISSDKRRQLERDHVIY